MGPFETSPRSRLVCPLTPKIDPWALIGVGFLCLFIAWVLLPIAMGLLGVAVGLRELRNVGRLAAAAPNPKVGELTPLYHPSLSMAEPEVRFLALGPNWSRAKVQYWFTGSLRPKRPNPIKPVSEPEVRKRR